ncbi:hypothetical protein WA158_002562 [Blastocystis sp. Blastoise]
MAIFQFNKNSQARKAQMDRFQQCNPQCSYDEKQGICRIGVKYEGSTMGLTITLNNDFPNSAPRLRFDKQVNHPWCDVSGYNVVNCPHLNSWNSSSDLATVINTILAEIIQSKQNVYPNPSINTNPSRYPIPNPSYPVVTPTNNQFQPSIPQYFDPSRNPPYIPGIVGTPQIPNQRPGPMIPPMDTSPPAVISPKPVESDEPINPENYSISLDDNYAVPFNEWNLDAMSNEDLQRLLDSPDACISMVHDSSTFKQISGVIRDKKQEIQTLCTENISLHRKLSQVVNLGEDIHKLEDAVKKLEEYLNTNKTTINKNDMCRAIQEQIKAYKNEADDLFNMFKNDDSDSITIADFGKRFLEVQKLYQSLSIRYQLYKAQQ